MLQFSAWLKGCCWDNDAKRRPRHGQQSFRKNEQSGNVKVKPRYYQAQMPRNVGKNKAEKWLPHPLRSMSWDSFFLKNGSCHDDRSALKKQRLAAGQVLLGDVFFVSSLNCALAFSLSSSFRSWIHHVAAVHCRPSNKVVQSRPSQDKWPDSSLQRNTANHVSNEMSELTIVHAARWSVHISEFIQRHSFRLL